nr:VapC toxin family PIN domain ribonuclease [Haladaptatus sp. DYSN1]
MPVPASAEVLVGEGNLPSGDVTGARVDLSWGEKYEIDERTAVTAGAIADEVGPSGPYLDGLDALIAAVRRELDTSVVPVDGDLTNEETKKVIDVEEY